MESELIVSTTTDSAAIAAAAANGNEVGARIPEPRPEVEELDGSSVVSFEHPRSERTMLLERLAAHEADLEALTGATSEQVTSTETGEEETTSEQEPDAEILQAIRDAAVADAVEHARASYYAQQQQAHLAEHMAIPEPKDEE